MPENASTTASASARLPVCASADLEEGGKGKRFPVLAFGHETTGFVVRYGGQVHGYLNRCAHVPIELDWQEGEFFESSGLYLMCATHGAVYEPDTGRCVGGPCRGGRLLPIATEEADGQVWWLPNEQVRQAGQKSPTMPSIPIHPVQAKE